MMNRPLTLVSLSLMLATGCTSHLVFFEEDHLGLKASFEANNPTPAQLSLGYRRGVAAVVPQQSQSAKPSANVSVTATNSSDGTKTVTVITNPNELMSLYTVFNANIGFGDPLQVKHFLATGSAASALLSDNDELRNVAAAIKNSAEQKGGAQ